MLQGDEFNQAILESVASIAAEWPSKGYDINSYFTHDLPYGPDCCVKANHPPQTMCVAAVTEIILTALAAWFKKTGDQQPFQKLPITSWQRGTKRDIRGHIFMYDGFGSNGTAHALSRFGVGRQLPFSELEPGAFINLNRARSGHACVFLGYIDSDGNDVAPYGSTVAGFRYFSSQGRNPGGFGYRWAFFDGHCPTLPRGRLRDCGVIRSDDPKLLCCGHMIAPEHWPSAPEIEAALIRDMTRERGRAEAIPAFEDELSRDYHPEPTLSKNFDGVTTDD
jgi:hypothetical protein